LQFFTILIFFELLIVFIDLCQIHLILNYTSGTRN